MINIGILCSLFTGCKREETTKTETNLPEGLSSVPLARRLASYQTTERGFGKIPNDYHFPHSYTTYWVNQMRRLWGLTETRPHWPIDTFGALRTDLFYIISQTYQLTEDQKEKLIWEMEKYPEFQKLYQEPLENCIWDRSLSVTCTFSYMICRSCSDRVPRRIDSTARSSSTH